MADLLPSDTGTLVREIPELGRRVSWRQDLAAFFSLLRLCREFRPDIVHTHTAKAGTLGRLAALKWRRADGARCKIVHTFHGNVLSGYFGPAASTAVRAIERTLARSTDRILVVSPQQEEEIVSLLGIPRNRIRLIRLGLALDELAAPHPSTRDQWGFSPGRPVIGIVGRIVPIKNHELFLRAARRFVDEGGAAGFVVVGGGDRELEMRQLAAGLNLDEHVRFAGWRRDLRRVYAGLDIVTLTSRNEGTPVALIEAMAAARPVVATAVGGVADVVEHERTGLLVASDDADAMSSAWDRLLGDRAVASSMGLRARESVLQRYGRHRLLDEVRDLYMELLDAPC
jgi:glycosyltransferase involved in cell wall biosynthesis